MVTKTYGTSWFLYAFIFLLLVVLALTDAATASDEYTRTGKANTSGEMREFNLISPANLSGVMDLQVWDQEGCLVEYECWARARNSKMAREFTELVEVIVESSNGVVTLNLETPHNAPWEGTNYAIKMTLEVYVSSDIVLVTKTRNFQLDISGPLRRADIKNSYGDVRLSEVLEETTIDGSYSKVEVDNIQGGLDIETSYNEIRVSDTNTEDGRATLKTTYGRIQVEQFEGQLEASTVYSPIQCSGLSLLEGENQIRTMYSTIDLEIDEIEDCGLYVTNSYGNVNLVVPADLSARLRLSVDRGGKINTNRILIKPLVLDKTRLEGICGDGDSNIGVQVNGIGKIQIEGR
jgi:hypothetical protein